MSKGAYQHKKGYKRPQFSKEWREKLSKASLGNMSHYLGEKVGYWGLHRWLDRELGRPRECEKCGSELAKRYEWANISGEYKRDIDDFIRLCKKCHCGFDKERKGLTIQLIKNWDAQRP